MRRDLDHLFSLLNGDYSSDASQIIVEKFILDQKASLTRAQKATLEELQKSDFEISVKGSLSETGKRMLGTNEKFNSITSMYLEGDMGKLLDLNRIQKKAASRHEFICKDITVSKATKICSLAIPINDCKSVIDRDSHIQACVKDLGITGDLSFVESSSSSHRTTCHLEIQVLRKINQFNIVASSLQKSLGYEENKCKDDCSGNGVCSSFGCVCEDGFMGESCSHKFTDLKEDSYLDSVLEAFPEILYQGAPIGLNSSYFVGSTIPELSPSAYYSKKSQGGRIEVSLAFVVVFGFLLVN